MGQISAKAPKCKTCGANHWTYQPHVFAGEKQPLTPVGEVEAPLTAQERRRYDELKATVKEAWSTFAAAITEIRDKRLFRIEYRSFDAFCQGELGQGRSYADKLITAGAIATIVRTSDLPVPANESVARTLAPLKDNPPALREAWSETVAKHGPEATAAQTAPAVLARITGVTKDAEYEAGLKRMPSNFDPPAIIRAVDIAPEPPGCQHEHLVCRDCGQVIE